MNPTIMMVLFLSAITPALPATPSCAKVEHGVCLNQAKPILRIIKGTHDPAACCAHCLNLTACVSWNVNSGMDQGETDRGFRGLT
jgi:hypothetical protein